MFTFFFNDTATTEIYTLSLHDALPIWVLDHSLRDAGARRAPDARPAGAGERAQPGDAGRDRARARPGGAGLRCSRSEEHTSELQSRQYLVCRLLLEKKKKQYQFCEDVE